MRLLIVEDEKCCIEVTDTGIGISKEAIEHILKGSIEKKNLEIESLEEWD